MDTSTSLNQPFCERVRQAAITYLIHNTDFLVIEHPEGRKLKSDSTMTVGFRATNPMEEEIRLAHIVNNLRVNLETYFSSPFYKGDAICLNSCTMENNVHCLSFGLYRRDLPPLDMTIDPPFWL